MRLSIIVPVLNSHEIVRRQILHFRSLDIPDDVEIIYVDDGSDPPLNRDDYDLKNFTIHTTNDTRAWTWALARNAGAKIAKGENLFMIDLDYIIPAKAIEDAANMEEDRMNVRREFGVLDEDGVFTQDLEILRQYGLTEERIAERGVHIPAHLNHFVMKKEAFFKLGGYREDLVGRKYPQGEDRGFAGVVQRAVRRGVIKRTYYRPLVFMFPNGKFCGDKNYNPFNLFHTLRR